MNRFANLADRKPTDEATVQTAPASPVAQILTPPSRVGRKAISGYFSPELSLALHTCARRHGLSLQDLMAEAFDDVLRKYGESPIGQ
ncbi:MAG: hypothetical protein B7Y36_07485 [Novosphingobium sp. 28-62-57]|jgi:hypothetical protein|uniref:ribbon-helix-helix domain-containing protein n=1 Tax=unclassified Novosphingobium TaxID=2644732 RepID=UPI000BD22800|nr:MULTISPECIES: ribbon-helix-helix domain-containing protein [unclassified Novosphingobium]OYW50994.1 MAG: hypothetical protein B7Z34_01535 [Novosphingobium sp. 12-62-10]OYZ11184.1 MAG: hypothetical protein B7Y36_07485 [Novosphingobium sp. 28-62-57]OZA36241.1 MAG: hypothetical protein B7X92_07070 [Novosphingobium sp. 17-62-9]